MSAPSPKAAQKLLRRTGEELLTYRRIRALSLFGDLPPRMEGRLRGQGGQGAVVIRRYRKGEVVCRQHEPGWTAFYLLKGEDLLMVRQVHLAMANAADEELAERAPDELALSKGERRKLAEALEKADRDAELADLLFASAGRPEEGEIEALVASLAHPVKGDLAVVSVAGPHRETPPPTSPVTRLVSLLRGASTAPPPAAPEVEVGTLGEGELFGELSCLYHTPRSATVRALRDFYAIELLGSVLEMLLASDAFRRELDATYRRRMLVSALQATPLFEDAPDEALALLQSRAELVRLSPGEILFAEGAVADGVYLVRSGTVTLSPSRGGPRRYRSRGETFGELEVVHGGPRRAMCAGYVHPRAPAHPSRREPTAVPIELVRLPAALLDEVAALYPAFRPTLARAVDDEGVARASIELGTSRAGDLGLAQGRSLLLVDLTRCTRCNDCVQACADVQSDGFPRLALEGPCFGDYLVAASCRKCTDAVCLTGCPVRSIHKGEAGQIVIESWCIGCGLCAEQCPYQAIDMRALPAPRPPQGVAEALSPSVAESSWRASTCDQCADVSGGPRCVAACAHEAAFRVDARTFFDRPPVR